MPFASSIAIKVNGNDITHKVLFSTARFEMQLGAMPGLAEMTVKDLDQSFSIVSGDELTLDIDGQRMWGGFVLTPGRQFALPVVDTTIPANVKARQFVLRAVDYNILFDKRVIHNPSDHLSHLPYFGLSTTMGALLRDQLFPSYLDLDDDGLDTSTFVDNGFVPRFDADGNPDPDGTKQGSWPQQGSYWRVAMEDFAQFGFVYYIDAEKNIHFHEAEDTIASWGFSDVPNNNTLPDPTASIGMREYEDTTDASAMANDAFVWGGSDFGGATVFKRATNAGSVTDHGRWQYAEVKIGELKDQGMVTARANVIVSGNTTGSVGGDTARGLAVDQKQCRVAWFAHKVPQLAGEPVHLRAGQVVTITMYTLTEDGINPLVLVLPLRTMKITFPAIPASGTPDDPMTYVRFDGFFGVQLSDPWWMWKLLRDISPSIKPPPIIAVADGSTTATLYGAIGQFAVTPSPDGANTVFAIPFAYIDGTTQVYKGPTGALALQTPDVDYTESTPEEGEITFMVAPSGADTIWVVCRVAGGI